MRLPNTDHTSRPWRIRDIAADFTVEDVWALPVHGAADDFGGLLGIMIDDDPNTIFRDSASARFLWKLRDLLGRIFNLGTLGPHGDDPESLTIPGDDRASLAERLPDDLRHTADDLHFRAAAFTPLYRTDDEFAAEMSNRTMHGVMHWAWVRRNDGIYQGQLAVYVKPRGVFGRAYMAFIRPFRYLIVYPALLRHLETAWYARLSAAPVTR